MKRKFFNYSVKLPILLWPLLLNSNAFSASLSESLTTAKQEAQAKGFVFLTSHDEVEAKAKGEGRLRALSGLDAATMKAMKAAFNKKYPFIDTYVEEIEGTDAYQRFLLELKSGRSTGWDAAFIPMDLYEHFLPFQKKFDIFGMASLGVLNISPRMVDPVNRNTVSANSVMQVVAYNRKLILEDKVPDQWEDFLKPEFKGKKFLIDIRPKDVAGMVPAWGLEKTLDFARKLAAQQPVWIRGGPRAITSMIAGEHTLFLGPNFSTVKRAQGNDATGALGYKIVEPVPIRLISRGDGVLKTADHPYAALLWLEFQGSAEGQKILDDYGPFSASVYTPGSAMEKETRGKKLSGVDWYHLPKMEQYEAKIVEAYGFPRAK